MDIQNQREKIGTYIKSFYTELTEDDEPRIQFVIDTVIDEVVIYCNFEDENEIPDQLLTTMSHMALDLINQSSIFKTADQIEDGDVKSIRQGDTTVTRVTSAERLNMLNSVKMIGKNYNAKLNRCRRLVW